jgi:cysteine sulfinate desulfinase/cysteine desulfurase-like protein
VYQIWYIFILWFEINSISLPKTNIMAVLNFTSREFRSKQAHVFDLADQGEKIVIRRSKKQSYTLVPLEDEDITFTQNLEERIGMALQEVKMMQEGKIKELSMNELLDEL